MFEGISGYILGIVGIVLLGVLIDLILPDGQMNKYIRGIMAFFLMAVMISPLYKFLDINNIDTGFIYDQSSYQLNNSFLERVNSQTANQLKSQLEKELKNGGFDHVIVEIEHNLLCPTFELEKIVVNIKNMVMNTNSVHINKYTEIKNIIIKCVLIEEDKIVFDE